MGAVYVGRHRLLGNAAAVKVVKEGAFDNGLERRFLAEARAIATIRHPSIVEFYEFGKNDELKTQ
jgi:serine/threonine protein kinase